MATFAKLEQLSDHAKYKALLKVALGKAKPAAALPFSYFEKFKFKDKVLPLVLADHEPALLAEVKKAAGNPTAIGKCLLNQNDELVFEPSTGNLNRTNLKKYLATFPGVKPVWIPGGASDEAESPRPTSVPAASPDALKEPLAAWQAARNKAIVDLKQLEAKIKAMADREGDAAIVLLRAIQANLTERPSTLQQVVELEKYLQTDSIITDAESPNGFGIKITLRKPLLDALAKIKAAVAGIAR